MFSIGSFMLCKAERDIKKDQKIKVADLNQYQPSLHENMVGKYAKQDIVKDTYIEDSMLEDAQTRKKRKDKEATIKAKKRKQTIVKNLIQDNIWL